jgi:DNA-binding response OmpR family regulator
MELPSDMNPAKILVVEDERDVRDLILIHLKRTGYVATGVERGELALNLLKHETFDLVILDWMLPGASGIELAKQLRGKLPILMVTARAGTADIILGLEAGADDYVTKPFEIPILIARIKALLRRTANLNADNKVELKAGNLTVNTETYKVFCGAEPVHLTVSEFKLLLALMNNAGRVLSREKLIELVQGQGVVVVDRAIDTLVFGLRKKLGACAEIIETVRGVGYRVQA